MCVKCEGVCVKCEGMRDGVCLEETAYSFSPIQYYERMAEPWNFGNTEL